VLAGGGALALALALFLTSPVGSAAAHAHPAPATSLPPLPDDPLAAVARESEVTFKSGDVTLAATLALPPKGGGRFPAVVFVPAGAYEEYDRDAKYFGIALFRQIAQRLAAHGVASLRYDKRGVGKSSGDLGVATVDILAADARAAFNFLRGHPAIDPKRTGVLGHGEGGAILLVAFGGHKPPPAAVVLLAASSATGEEAIRENYRNAIESAPNVDPAERKKALERQDFLIKAVRAGGDGLQKVGLLEQKRAGHPYFKSLLDLDPRPYLAKVRAPALLVHGQKDRQVSADHALELKKILSENGHRQVTLIIDPEINHLLMLARTGTVTEYPALGVKADPQTVERIADWAAKILRSGRRAR